MARLFLAGICILLISEFALVTGASLAFAILSGPEYASMGLIIGIWWFPLAIPMGFLVTLFWTFRLFIGDRPVAKVLFVACGGLVGGLLFLGTKGEVGKEDLWRRAFVTAGFVSGVLTALIICYLSPFVRRVKFPLGGLPADPPPGSPPVAAD